MIRYYCSGFDTNPNQAFAHGIGDMLKRELKNTKSIIYIPAGEKKVQKTKEKYIPNFEKCFKSVGIEFENTSLEDKIITPDMDSQKAIELIKNASMIMLTGGDPYELKKMCENLNIIEALKNYDGVMMGYSAGAMFMSKYIIITPCSEEYPDFHIENGLNLDGISIFPHNNTSEEEYPEILDVGGETYRRNDNIKVAQEYGEYYLLQDQTDDDMVYNISIVKSTDGNIEYYTENNGKIWLATGDEIKLLIPKLSKKNRM